MKSYTFASDDAIAAVLAAFDASGDDTYDMTAMAWSDDMTALVFSLAEHASNHPNTPDARIARELLTGIGDMVDVESPDDCGVILSALEHSDRRYHGAWEREEFAVVVHALRGHWDNAPEGDDDGSTHDNAGSMLSSIAETLGIEFV